MTIAGVFVWPAIGYAWHGLRYGTPLSSASVGVRHSMSTDLWPGSMERGSCRWRSIVAARVLDQGVLTRSCPRGWFRTAGDCGVPSAEPRITATRVATAGSGQTIGGGCHDSVEDFSHRKLPCEGRDPRHRRRPSRGPQWGWPSAKRCLSSTRCFTPYMPVPRTGSRNVAPTPHSVLSASLAERRGYLSHFRVTGVSNIHVPPTVCADPRLPRSY